MKALKVYGWQDHRCECKPRTQTREICAAHSMAEVARIAGYRRASQMFNLCETGNDFEIKTAMAKPGAVFWRSISCFNDSKPFTEATP
jgi:hypothetical protein